MPAVITHGSSTASAAPAMEAPHPPHAPRNSGGVVVGRSGRAVIRKYIMGQAGLRTPAAVSAEIAMNLICQSNQKENPHFK